MGVHKFVPMDVSGTIYLDLLIYLHLLNNIIYNSNFLGIQLKFKGREEAFTEDQITIKEPFYLFKKWFEEILNDKDVIEPNAVALATASK